MVSLSYRSLPSTPSLRRLCACLAAALGIASATPSNASLYPARSIVVENCDDNGVGSLREAYAAASDGDTIDLSALACSTITLTTGPLQSAPDAGYVVLQGNRAAHLTIDGSHASRVIVHSGRRVAVQDIDVTAGVAHDAYGGGCVYSSGDVSLLEATVSNCEVSTSGGDAAKGGGVRALRGVFLRRSRVTGNRAHASAADADGGGIHAQYLIMTSQNTISGNIASGDGSHYARGGGIFAVGYLDVDSTTVSDNQADSGGGIYVGYLNTLGDPRLVNATISGNHADSAAGGILCARSLHSYNSTITENTAVFDFGAGVYLSAGDLELRSTIVANNTSGDGLQAADIAGHPGAAITGAHDLVIASTLALPGDTLSGDPMLGPLADNGGGVDTHALRARSPAIDAGDNPLYLFVDEREFVCSANGACVRVERQIGPAVDIGAFEFGAPDQIFANGFEW